MGDVYQAEKILDTKLIKGKRYFYIKWHGWDEKHNTWEPKRNIIDTRLIDIYFKSLKKKNDSSTKREKSSKEKNPNCYDFSDEDSNETDISSNLIKTDPAANKSSTTKTPLTKNNNNVQQDELRSAIREAGGLRPIVKQNQSNNSSKKLNSSRKKIVSDDSDESESVDNESKSKALCKNKKFNKSAKGIKLNKRRKVSSSRSFSSSSSSLVPAKKRQTRIKYSEDEYEDYNSNEEEEENDESSSDTIEAANDDKKQTTTVKKETKEESVNNKENYRTNNEIFTDENENENDAEETSFDDSATMLTMISNSEDVFVTDVTSGVVTVTIKECISMDGFFKKRDIESDT